MPYIKTTTSVKMTDEQKVKLKNSFGKAIELIPGKSENWLMLAFEDGVTMAFRGDMETPAAMVEIDIFGAASSSAYDALTEKVCAVVSEILSVSPERIYVKYRECDRWGFNGFNF